MKTEPEFTWSEENKFMKHSKLVFLSAALAAFMLPAAAQSTGTPTEPPTKQQPANPAQRYDNQQDRIAQGIKDGQLTSGEAAQLEKKETQLKNEALKLKKEDGGKLSKQ